MTPLSYWIWFHVALAVLLALEFGLSRLVRDTRRKAIWAVSLWALVAVGLAGLLVRPYGSNGATQYLASYVLEQSLSIDNLFVFLLLFRLFRVPENRQPKVLFWGVTGAMVMRGLFIAAGVGLLARFHWIEYVFAAILGYAAIRMMIPSHDSEEETPAWIGWLTKWRPISMTTDHFFVIEEGQKMATMLLLALIAVELTDVVFALDSIPAVLSITRVPFLAYTSNIMAVMSLRSLYVLLALALSKLKFLHYGMGVVLLFAAAKMLAQDWIEIGPGVSLAVIAGVLGVTIVASLVAARGGDSAVS
ncbi:TerC/Alx family metal homeostasis membrane protein [Granulicella paludicola]|uniref:TerC/Alx family metal homeostasis membrane protein n=1 Tax=Granulicella paludicola TaxID=474951 RepID=UPI0021DF476E|nr:TerC/Alx family metal homeostasis membrane protein [Granulicella paludicola]